MSNRIDSASGNFREGLNNNSWMVCDPDGTPFWELPQPCNERTAMAAIRLARHCAKEEFARGKKMGGDAMLAANRQRMQEMASMITFLKEENTRIAATLERAIGG